MLLGSVLPTCDGTVLPILILSCLSWLCWLCCPCWPCPPGVVHWLLLVGKTMPLAYAKRRLPQKHSFRLHEMPNWVMLSKARPPMNGNNLCWFQNGFVISDVNWRPSAAKLDIFLETLAGTNP